MQVRYLKLTGFVYIDDIRLLSSSPQHLQALIDALVTYCATLHMESSVAKTEVMVVSKPSTRSPTPKAAVVTCNGLPVERVNTFKYMGLHFHASGDVSRLITPLKGKGGRLLGCSAAKTFSAAVWQHSQPRTLFVAKHPCTVSALRL